MKLIRKLFGGLVWLPLTLSVSAQLAVETTSIAPPPASDTAFYLPAMNVKGVLPSIAYAFNGLNVNGSELKLNSVADVQTMLEALQSEPAASIDTLPKNRFGQVSGSGFWSLQNPYWPPLPANTLGLPAWSLGNGRYILDDRDVDYAELNAEAKLEAAAQVTLAAPMMRMSMMSSLSTAYAYGNPIYLTNLAAAFASDGSMTANFSIGGGTNFVPYDILTTTNLTTPISNLNWLGIGYTSNNYTFYEQPASLGFYMLAKPSKTMTVGWGFNYFNQCDPPIGLTNAQMIAGGGGYTVALLNNGTAVGWGGRTTEGSIPTNLTGIAMIASGINHKVALLTNGTVLAWGDNSFGQCNVSAGLSSVVDVAGGWTHSVALKADGTIVCWGGNSLGELNVPAGLSNVVAIAAAGYPNYSSYTIALKKDGTVATWGKNLAALPLNGLNNVISIGAEYDSGFAIRTGPPTPVITLEPVDQYLAAGGSATFTSKGQGLYGVTYQWQFTNVNLAGATSPTLTLTNVQTTNQGAYRVVVTANAGNGSIASSNANLTLIAPPVIISQAPLPTNQLAVYQTNLTLSVVATGTGQASGFPLNFQWQLNGTNISGANLSSYTLLVDTPYLGNYSVVVTNIAGSVTSLVWSVSVTYAASYIDVGTLAYHLSTNAVGRTNGYTPAYNNTCVFSGWTSGAYSATNMVALTNSVWSTNCWLQGVHGLSGTCLGFSNAPAGTGGQGPMTLVSPRHYLCATHMHPESYMDAFLDTNNVIYWRKSVQRVDIGNDTSVGILDADLPPSVEFMAVIPTNAANYLPSNGVSFVQGIGMNQQKQIFSEPIKFDLVNATWDCSTAAPFGINTNWNINIQGGDSSNPAMILISNQLVLVSHNFAKPSYSSPITYGPNYSSQFALINQAMHFLSTNNASTSDYQTIQFQLTNWPSIH